MIGIRFKSFYTDHQTSSIVSFMAKKYFEIFGFFVIIFLLFLHFSSLKRKLLEMSKQFEATKRHCDVMKATVDEQVLLIITIYTCVIWSLVEYLSLYEFFD